jgi:hypothetical protein
MWAVNMSWEEPMTDKPDQEVKSQDQKDFIDPVATAAVGLFVLVEVVRACISFFTRKVLSIWWQRNIGDKDVTDNQGLSEEESPEEA